MKQTRHYSTGAQALDSLVEEVRQGDNFVFATSSLKWFKPFAQALLQHSVETQSEVTVIRLDGSLDDITRQYPDDVHILDIKEFADPKKHLHTVLSNEIKAGGKDVYYLFDNASEIQDILGSEQDLIKFFTTFAPLFHKNRSVTYWSFNSRHHSASTMAELKDWCPVFIKLSRKKGSMILRIIKAVNRYSDRMFLPHYVIDEQDQLRFTPLENTHRSFREYAHELEIKNRELLRIKNTYEVVQQQLLQRTRDLRAVTRVAIASNRYVESTRIFASALNTAMETLNVDGGAIFLRQKRVESRFKPQVCENIDFDACENFAQAHLWDRIIGNLSKFNQPVLLFDTDKSDCSRWLNNPGEQPWTVIFLSPLRTQKKLAGIMLLVARNARLFTSNDIATLKSISNQIALSIAHCDLYDQIRESSTRYRSLFESAQDGIFILDSETGTTQEANHQAVSLTGYSSRQLKEVPFWDLTSKDHRDRVLSYFRNGNFENQIIGEMPLLRKDGSMLMTEIHSNLVQLGGKRLVQCIMRNITSRVKTERMHREAVKRAEQFNEELTRKNRELEEIARSKTEFLHFVSHELRTPLMSLQWSARCLHRLLKNVDIEDTQHLLHIVQEDSQKLSSLVNQLLEFSRIDAKRMHINKRAGSILPLIHNIIENKKDRIQKKQIKFSVHTPKNLAKVLFDPQQIEVVLHNLIDNSLKYSSSKGTIAIHIKQRMTPTPEQEIRVIDDGAGIPAEDLERVFEKFYRGTQKEILQTAGTGLGLPISKAIVEAHHGRIWAEKPAKKGCIMAFTLPMVEE